MSAGVEPPDERVVRLFAMLLLAGAAAHLIVAIAAGFVEWHNATGPFFPGGRERAYDVLSTFGQGGDGLGLVLAVVATLLVWWLSGRGDPGAGAFRSSVCWVLAATGLLAALEATGIGIIASKYPSTQVSRLVLSGGFAVIVVLVACGAIVLTRQYAIAIDEALMADDLDAFVFALDRHSIDVRAFFTVRDAVRGMHIYSVEDNEFDFYTDEGEVLRASVVDDRVALQPSGVENLAELMDRLKEFTLRRGITIDEADADDPTAYVDPINKWQWLEMWPPWMRPLGYLFRRR